jgi:hypothetical protein
MTPIALPLHAKTAAGAEDEDPMLTLLFRLLKPKDIATLVCCMLLERKVLFLADASLLHGTLTPLTVALCSLLYPFDWNGAIQIPVAPRTVNPDWLSNPTLSSVSEANAPIVEEQMQQLALDPRDLLQCPCPALVGCEIADFPEALATHANRLRAAAAAAVNQRNRDRANPENKASDLNKARSSRFGWFRRGSGEVGDTAPSDAVPTRQSATFAHLGDGSCIADGEAPDHDTGENDDESFHDVVIVNLLDGTVSLPVATTRLFDEAEAACSASASALGQSMRGAPTASAPVEKAAVPLTPMQRTVATDAEGTASYVGASTVDGDEIKCARSIAAAAPDGGSKLGRSILSLFRKPLRSSHVHGHPGETPFQIDAAHSANTTATLSTPLVRAIKCSESRTQVDDTSVRTLPKSSDAAAFPSNAELASNARTDRRQSIQSVSSCTTYGSDCAQSLTSLVFDEPEPVSDDAPMKMAELLSDLRADVDGEPEVASPLGNCQKVDPERVPGSQYDSGDHSINRKIRIPTRLLRPLVLSLQRFSTCSNPVPVVASSARTKRSFLGSTPLERKPSSFSFFAMAPLHDDSAYWSATRQAIVDALKRHGLFPFAERGLTASYLDDDSVDRLLSKEKAIATLSGLQTTCAITPSDDMVSACLARPDERFDALSSKAMGCGLACTCAVNQDGIRRTFLDFFVMLMGDFDDHFVSDCPATPSRRQPGQYFSSLGRTTASKADSRSKDLASPESPLLVARHMVETAQENGGKLTAEYHRALQFLGLRFEKDKAVRARPHDIRSFAQALFSTQLFESFLSKRLRLEAWKDPECLFFDAFVDSVANGRPGPFLTNPAFRAAARWSCIEIILYMQAEDATARDDESVATTFCRPVDLTISGFPAVYEYIAEKIWTTLWRRAREESEDLGADPFGMRFDGADPLSHSVPSSALPLRGPQTPMREKLRNMTCSSPFGTASSCGFTIASPPHALALADGSAIENGCIRSQRLASLQSPSGCGPSTAACNGKNGLELPHDNASIQSKNILEDCLRVDPKTPSGVPFTKARAFSPLFSAAAAAETRSTSLPQRVSGSALKGQQQIRSALTCLMSPASMQTRRRMLGRVLSTQPDAANMPEPLSNSRALVHPFPLKAPGMSIHSSAGESQAPAVDKGGENGLDT